MSAGSRQRMLGSECYMASRGLGHDPRLVVEFEVAYHLASDCDRAEARLRYLLSLLNTLDAAAAAWKDTALPLTVEDIDKELETEKGGDDE